MSRKEKSRILLPLLFIFSFIILLAVSIYARFFISFSLHAMDYNMDHRLITAAQWLSTLVTVDELDNYQTAADMEKDGYQALRRQLLDFSIKTNLLYAYYSRPSGNGFQYIIDNDFNEETRVGLDTEPYQLSGSPWLADVLEGKTVTSGMGSYSAGWDGLSSAFVPMFDNNGNVAAFAGVDVEDEDIVSAQRMVTVLTIVQIIAIAVIFISGITGLMFFRRQARIAKDANEKLKSLVTTDELTKLDNRRSFLEYLNLIWRQNMRLNLPVSALMIDIDLFKYYNDTLGHLEGDKALIAVARCMKDQIKRETDFIARFGGEEFICLLPFLDKNEALQFGEKLVQSVEDMKLPHPKSTVSKYVTVSVGLATVTPDGNVTQSQFIDEADKALYKAKQSGRNRVAAAE